MNDYFTSPEAFILFAPKKNENVTQCLVRRIEMLGEGTSDDNVLSMLCAQDEVNNISNKGMTHLRMQFIYLRKAYEIALQYMNGNTWKECCEMSIMQLDDNGTTYISSPLTLMKWNKQFKKKDSFEVPFLKEGREPKLFQFFPEAKNEIIKFCSEGVKVDVFQAKQCTVRLGM